MNSEQLTKVLDTYDMVTSQYLEKFAEIMSLTKEHRTEDEIRDSLKKEAALYREYIDAARRTTLRTLTGETK